MPENPFTYGNPVSDPKSFIGRQREAETIISRLRTRQFESTSLVGERRIGKTSLLQYVANPTVRATRGLDLDKFVFVYINLQMVSAAMTPNQLWKRILLQLSRTIDHPDMQRLIEATRSI